MKPQESSAPRMRCIARPRDPLPRTFETSLTFASQRILEIAHTSASRANGWERRTRLVEESPITLPPGCPLHPRHGYAHPAKIDRSRDDAGVHERRCLPSCPCGPQLAGAAVSPWRRPPSGVSSPALARVPARSHGDEVEAGDDRAGPSPMRRLMRLAQAIVAGDALRQRRSSPASPALASARFEEGAATAQPTLDTSPKSGTTSMRAPRRCMSLQPPTAMRSPKP